MVRSSSRLNLAGLLLLLIVLDGVVNTPERIVMMITNHPGILVSTRPRPGLDSDLRSHLSGVIHTSGF